MQPTDPPPAPRGATLRKLTRPPPERHTRSFRQPSVCAILLLFCACRALPIAFFSLPVILAPRPAIFRRRFCYYYCFHYAPRQCRRPDAAGVGKHRRRVTHKQTRFFLLTRVECTIPTHAHAGRSFWRLNGAATERARALRSWGPREQDCF